MHPQCGFHHRISYDEYHYSRYNVCQFTAAIIGFVEFGLSSLQLFQGSCPAPPSRASRSHHHACRPQHIFSCGRIHQPDKPGELRESLSPVLCPVLFMFPDSSHSLPFIIQAPTEIIQTSGR